MDEENGLPITPEPETFEEDFEVKEVKPSRIKNFLAKAKAWYKTVDWWFWVIILCCVYDFGWFLYHCAMGEMKSIVVSGIFLIVQMIITTGFFLQRMIITHEKHTVQYINAAINAAVTGLIGGISHASEVEYENETRIRNE